MLAQGIAMATESTKLRQSATVHLLSRHFAASPTSTPLTNSLS
jgi:hypothetical protein